MAIHKPPGNLGTDPTPPSNNTDNGTKSGGYPSNFDDNTDVGLEDDDQPDDVAEVQDADLETTETEEVDESDLDGEHVASDTGVAVIPKTGLQRQQGMTVSHRAEGARQRKQTTGSLPSEPKLVNKAYEVNKAAIKDNLLQAGYQETLLYQDMAPVTKQLTMSGGLPVHPDLTRCFAKLVPFLAHVTEQVQATPYELEEGQDVPELWRNFVVTKVAISGTGVVITGHRKLKGNRQLTINTPHIDYNSDRDSWYRHADIVEQLVEDLKAEVALAIEGKAFNPQLGLFDDSEAA